MLFRYLMLPVLFGLITVADAQEVGHSEKYLIDRLISQADADLGALRFQQSLEKGQEALKRSLLIRDNYLIARSYNSIAGNYDELSEPDKAIGYYKKGLIYANLTDNDSLRNWLHNNLGNMYCFEKKEYEKGIAEYEKSLAYSAKTRDTSQLVFTNLNMAWAYFDIGDFAKGDPHLDFVNRYFPRFGERQLASAHLLLQAMSAGNAGRKAEAGRLFPEAIAMAKKTGELLDESYACLEFSKYLKRTGQHAKAYSYLEEYQRIKEIVYNQNKLQRAEAQGVNLEIDEYKRALSRIESEKEIQALSLKKSQLIVILFVFCLLTLSLLSWMLYRNNIFRKKKNAELQKTNEALTVAKDKAEEATRLKTQFISTISHELRTPLYGVVGITNMISDEHQELAESPHLNSLKFSAKYLLSLVNDILQINKIEEKRLILEKMTFNLSDELHTIADSLQFIAQRNNNRLEVRVDDNIPELLIGDKLRLSQIFMNLVGNALKFTSDGLVVITAEQERISGKQHFIAFSVSDNGIGIAREDQEKIFEKFVQIERKESDYQGTGLGLPIVRKLVELFGGEIRLESQEGIGTRFYFTIPLDCDPEQTAEIVNNIEVDLSSGQIFNILVVEDNKINQMVTKKILQSHNFRCQIVDDGIAALAVLSKKNSFDLILMDINMPVINGFETTRRLRAQGVETPVVALTAYDKAEITEEAISAGMNDIIIKPFEPVKLFQVIMAQINRNAPPEPAD